MDADFRFKRNGKQSKEEFLKLDVNQNTQKNTQSELDLDKVVIYPCCYEVSSLNTSEDCNRTKLIHLCMFNQDNKANQRVIPNNLLQISSLFYKNSKNDKNPPNKVSSSKTECSLCEKEFQGIKNKQIYKCLNCRKSFCKKCNEIVHGKGKFMSHHIEQITGLNPQILSSQNRQLICKKHNKSRTQLFQNKIVCIDCSGQQPADLKHVTAQNLPTLQISSVEQNLKFSLEYFTSMYHNQANKLSSIKQTYTNLYHNLIYKIQQKFQLNLTQIERIEGNLKNQLTKNIQQLEKITEQIQVIGLLENKFGKFIGKLESQCLNVRVLTIQNKLGQIQGNCEEFIVSSLFDYKISESDRNQALFQQFLKGFNITKSKKVQPDTPGAYTQRASLKNQLKSSRTASRQSSCRLTQSKDNRCTSSFKRNESNLSSNKDNPSFKNARQSSSIMKSFTKSYKKNEQIESNLSSNTSRRTPGRSIDKSLSMQQSVQQSVNASRNNSTFFREKPLIDIKELQKAQYQDMNLNLKKLIISKKSTLTENASSIRMNKQIISSQLTSESTSLQKFNHLTKQPSFCRQNPSKKHLLTKQNQKSAINSGSFLKIFDNAKNKVSARKNYLVSSAQQLQPQKSQTKQRKSKIQLNTSSIKIGSPDGRSQIKRGNIKKELFQSGKSPSGQNSNVFEETYSQFFENGSLIGFKSFTGASNQLTSGQSNSRSKDNESSAVFDNLIAVSCERSNFSIVTEFNCESKQNSHDRQYMESRHQNMQVSAFMSNPDSQYKKDCAQLENIQNIQMTKIIKVSQKHISQMNQKLNSKRSPVKKGQFYKEKPPSKDQKSCNADNKASTRIFKESANNMRKPSTQKPLVTNPSTDVSASGLLKQNSSQQPQQPIKKKTDFMDMRERMRKPNYLSAKLGNSFITKVNQAKK